MGTAGALSLIDFNINIPFFVVNGDVLTTVNFDDFLNFHTTQNADATMCVKRYSHEVPYACVEFDENMSLRGIKEKPSYDYFINTGMYILNPSSISYLKKDEYFDMPSLFELLIDNLFINDSYKFLQEDTVSQNIFIGTLNKGLLICRPNFFNRIKPSILSPNSTQSVYSQVVLKNGNKSNQSFL